MITIEKVVTPSPAQWEIVIEGMRNPHDSWDKIDSYSTYIEDADTLQTADFEFFMGDADKTLAKSLVEGGPVHAKFRRMLHVIFTVSAPLYFWKEFETYRTAVAPNPTDVEMNSCSTMHKIHAKEFTKDDFSIEHLMTSHSDSFPMHGIYDGIVSSPLGIFANTLTALNLCRERFIDTGDKRYWWQMIQLLPSSYNQTRTISLNYEVLANIYKWRKTHKLDEWRTFCKWIETLPYAELITGEEE